MTRAILNSYPKFMPKVFANKHRDISFSSILCLQKYFAFQGMGIEEIFKWSMRCNKKYGISVKKTTHSDQQRILTHFKIIEMSIAVRKHFPTYLPALRQHIASVMNV